jgi:hypothetical protein
MRDRGQPFAVLPPAVIALCVSMLAIAAPAPAHGPCGDCATPQRAAPGDRVRVKWTAIRVIFNPRRRDVPFGDKELWRAHHPDQRTRVVFRSQRPRTSGFTVPRVAPGKYGIAIFDGSEGGAHYTWTYVRVIDDVASTASSPAAPADRPGSQRDGTVTLCLVAVACVAGAVGLIIALGPLGRSRRRRAGDGNRRFARAVSQPARHCGSRRDG